MLRVLSSINFPGLWICNISVIVFFFITNEIWTTSIPLHIVFGLFFWGLGCYTFFFSYYVNILTSSHFLEKVIEISVS